MNYKLIIKLKSATCIALGASSGRSIDMDVYTNEYGFPFIPSKRLKGVIKDACKEYNLMVSDSIDIDRLFGTQDDIEGTLKISNAELLDYISEKDNIVLDIKERNINPRFVKRMYVSKRTQTSIDDETEKAKEGSLRTINVVNKGLTFVSEIENITGEEEKHLSDAIKLVRHIGLNRNRGLGLVECRLEKNNKSESKIVLPSSDFDYLELRIHNEKPLLLSSSMKNETVKYIMGSSIYGYFANEYAKAIKLGKNDVDPVFTKLFLSDNLIFTNAYISDDKFNEYVPVPRFIQREKNKNKDGKCNYINLLLDKPFEDKKKASLSNKYIMLSDLLDENGLPLNDLHVIEPIIENNYHHSLNENGIVDEFYSYESISANQNFVSRIYGDKELLKELFDKVNSTNAYLGKSKNSQYGKCNISIVGKKENKEKDGDIIVFTSPCEIKGDNDELALTIEDVIKYGKIEKKNTMKYALSFMTLGGFNMQWRLPKPQKTLIAQESYIEGSVDSSINVLGEEGYIGCGQFIRLNKTRLCKLNNRVAKSDSINNSMSSYKSKWAKEGRCFKLMSEDKVVEEAFTQYIGITSIPLNSHQIERVLKMIDEFDNFYGFKTNVENIADENYRNKVLKLIDGYEHAKYPLYFKTLFTLLKYGKR